jgi:glutaredoxin
MSATILYTREGCPACDRLREALAGRGERFTEVNLSREPQATIELLKLTSGRRIVPVLVRGAKIEVAPEGGTEF